MCDRQTPDGPADYQCPEWVPVMHQILQALSIVMDLDRTRSAWGSTNARRRGRSRTEVPPLRWLPRVGWLVVRVAVFGEVPLSQDAANNASAAAISICTARRAGAGPRVMSFTSICRFHQMNQSSPAGRRLLDDVFSSGEPATECGHEPPRLIRQVSFRRHRHDRSHRERRVDRRAVCRRPHRSSPRFVSRHRG